MRSRTAIAGRCAACLLAAVLAVLALGANSAGAETYTVKTTEELTSAVANANASKTSNEIILEGGTYLPLRSLKITSGPLTITGPTGSPSVEGEVASIIGTSVEPAFSELFTLGEGVSVTFRNIEVSGGGGLGAPAIEVARKGSLTLEDSTLEGNIGSAVQVDNEATLDAVNSTISDGSEFGILDSGHADLVDATVAYNTDGGIQNKGSLELTNTIVAENTGVGDCAGTAPIPDHSLDSDGSCHVGLLSKTNPLLQPNLENAGGSTPVHPLKPGSPAIGAGDPADCQSDDQRGAKRACPNSIGADEYNSTPPTLTVPGEIVVEEEGAEEAIVTYTPSPSAAGFENAIRRISCTPESESTFHRGTTSVECTAVDSHENKTTKSFNVKVTPKGGGAVAPTVVTGTATAITQTSATLNATVNPNGSNVTECTFEYGTSTSYGKSAACTTLPGSGTSAAGVSAPISSLTAGTTYHFRIVAKNAGGKSEGSDASFETSASSPPPPPPPNPVAPTVVTGTATAITPSSATLNATVNPNGSEVTECSFEYGTSTSYGQSAACSPLPGSGMSAVPVTTSISSLTAGTTYHFRIVAKNAGGKSEGSDGSFASTKLTPAAEVEKLLQGVKTARLPRGLRYELTSLLEGALRGLASTAARKSSVESAAARRQCVNKRALQDLDEFINVVKHNEGRHNPRQIPPALASEWIRQAQKIVASLGCGTG